jgi:hypothetical protein
MLTFALLFALPFGILAIGAALAPRPVDDYARLTEEHEATINADGELDMLGWDGRCGGCDVCGSSDDDEPFNPAMG